MRLRSVDTKDFDFLAQLHRTVGRTACVLVSASADLHTFEMSVRDPSTKIDTAHPRDRLAPPPLFSSLMLPRRQTEYMPLTSPSEDDHLPDQRPPPRRHPHPESASLECWEPMVLPLTVDEAQQLDWVYAPPPPMPKAHADSLTDALLVSSTPNVFLDPFYDVTTSRLRRLFAQCEHPLPGRPSSSCCRQPIAPSIDAGVSFENFAAALRALGISAPATVNFTAIARRIDSNQDGNISRDEFVHVVQAVKLAHLFKPSQRPSTLNFVLRVVDYSPTAIRAVAPVAQLERFMFSSKPAWASVRWVHLAGFRRHDDLNLRRLAIKYQLHPLALEDCLNPHDKIRCKFEHYDDHSFLVLPVLRPVNNTKRAHIHRAVTTRRRHRLAKHKAFRESNQVQHIDDHELDLGKATHTSHPPKPKPAKHSREELVETLDGLLHGLMRPPQQLCLFITNDNMHVLSVQDEMDNGHADGAVMPLWHLVYDRNLSKSYSKLRSHGNDASMLVVAIVSAVADEIAPLVAGFDTSLTCLGKLLRLDGVKFDTSRFFRLKKRLAMVDKVVRPLLDLVEDQLLDQPEFNHSEGRTYLRDVKNRLKQMATDVRDHQAALAALVDQDKQIRAQHQADVMYVMSVAAACFLPGTFMTGVYGMNFDNMPELHTTSGYFVWWGVLVTIATSLVLFLKFVKHWI
ncbi:Aste57867_12622 [Aphanomyces stellatus]|uniref:Aste57867_12622 protein n=1 Tax=Aphanomyces stellatus TaxID=120398 RepID=A0A485KWP9_9STRA|nr:hypothetical protein As57867_012576 [Aphanomyces stellatus]VFT89472.1 Aste57867_12622 [Aphanomyces stellatus]